MNNNDRISIFSFYLGVFCILWYMCSVSTLLLAWITMAGFPSSAPLGMCFAFYGTCVPFQHCSFFWDMIGFCGTCVPFQHCRLQEQQWQDFHLQLLLGYDCIMWYMCSISTLLLAVITFKYYTYVRRCWSFPEIFFLVGFSAMFMSFLPCCSPSKQKLQPCIIFQTLKPLTILKHIAE
jgi:hypothetical protein